MSSAAEKNPAPASVRRGSTPSTAFLVALAVLLALFHAVLAVTATAEKSMTADEIAHLTAGATYNARGDFRLQPENGNLPQRWAAIPLTLSRAPLPSATDDAWQRGDVWRYGYDLFYRENLSSDEMLFAGRSMVALFSAATALLVFAWSRTWFGWRGGFLSLTLYAFSPEFLAHGALATSDVVMTFFFVAATAAWWWQLEKPGVFSCLSSALVFGLAWVSKYSALLLVPVFAICSLVWLATQARSRGWRGPALWLARTIVVHLVVAWGMIWLFYGFRFSAFAPGDGAHAQFYRGDWAWILDDMGWPRHVFDVLRALRLLPEAFLYGFAFVLQFSKARAAFLNGHYSTTGWPMFFPFAFAVKSTLPFLLLLGTSLGAKLFHRRKASGKNLDLARLWHLTPLVALFVVYAATSITSHLNIGHRHILPLYPVLFIAAGSLGCLIDRKHLALGSVVLALAGWHVGESFHARPHYLAYFNELVGGSRHGWRHLVDSSLDWGQDLPGLSRWLATNARGERVFLSYFGAGDPAYEGIDATLLPRLLNVGPIQLWYRLTPGVYAVSATMLQQVYSDTRGPWTLALEKEYQQLHAIEPTLLAFQNDPRERASLLQSAPASNWTTAWKRYDQLRFARLCHYLRMREADANIGYSILVFRLDAAEIHGAVEGSIQDWEQLIEHAVTRRRVTVRLERPDLPSQSPPRD